MKKKYSSPELELIMFELNADVLSPSDPAPTVTEGSGSGAGAGEDPFGDF